MTPRYFEDFKPGDRFETDGVTINQSMILDYALKYDPQPFHLDVTAAEKSPYGGLIAPGWLTGALAFRMVLQTGIFHGGSLGSPGIDKVRWLKPVRPGDTIRMICEVEAVRLSSKGNRGYVNMIFQAYNQNDEPVMSWESAQILALRPIGDD